VHAPNTSIRHFIKINVDCPWEKWDYATGIINPGDVFCSKDPSSVVENIRKVV